MRRVLVVLLSGFAAVALAQTVVNQGAPGNYGSWPVKVTSGGITIDGGVTINAGSVTIDGGSVTALQGNPPWLFVSDGGYVSASQLGQWDVGLIGGLVTLDGGTATVSQGGAWNVGVTGSVNVNNFPGTQAVSQGTVPWDTSATQNGTWSVGVTGGQVTLDGGTTSVYYADSSSLDAFARLRVSQPLALFGSKLLWDSQPLFWDDQQTSGSGTASTYQTNKAMQSLTAQANVAGTRVRQTFRRMVYQPGKGQVIFMTGVLAGEGGTGITGINRRVGAFDGSNGYFFELSGTTLQVAVRTSTSGSPVTTYVPQASWNLDPMNGSGPSGIALDVSKAQLFVIDFQWLGTGRVRYGFNIGGRIIYVHQLVTSNSGTLVSIANPNLPLRYEIQSLGTGAAVTGTLNEICAATFSEGGQEDVGFEMGVDTGATALTTGNDTNQYALIAIQLQSGKLSATIEVTDYSVSTTTASTQFYVKLILNPTIAGSLSYSAVTNSAVQAAYGATANTVTGGTVIMSGIFQSNKAGSANDHVPIDMSIGANIAGVSDTLVLVVQPVPAGGAIPFYGTLNWKEQD